MCCEVPKPGIRRAGLAGARPSWSRALAPARAARVRSGRRRGPGPGGLAEVLHRGQEGWSGSRRPPSSAWPGWPGPWARRDGGRRGGAGAERAGVWARKGTGGRAGRGVVGGAVPKVPDWPLAEQPSRSTSAVTSCGCARSDATPPGGGRSRRSARGRRRPGPTRTRRAGAGVDVGALAGVGGLPAELVAHLALAEREVARRRGCRNGRAGGGLVGVGEGAAPSRPRRSRRRRPGRGRLRLEEQVHAEGTRCPAARPAHRWRRARRGTGAVVELAVVGQVALRHDAQEAPALDRGGDVVDARDGRRAAARRRRACAGRDAALLQSQASDSSTAVVQVQSRCRSPAV